MPRTPCSSGAAWSAATRERRVRRLSLSCRLSSDAHADGTQTYKLSRRCEIVTPGTHHGPLHPLPYTPSSTSLMLTYILAFALLLLRLLLRLLSLRSCAWRRVRACASSSLVSLPSSLRLSGVAFTRRPLLRRGCEPIPVPLRVSPASRSRAPPTRSAVAVHPRLCFFTLRRRRAAATTPRWPCLRVPCALDLPLSLRPLARASVTRQYDHNKAVARIRS